MYSPDLSGAGKVMLDTAPACLVLFLGAFAQEESYCL